jgi:PPOX class probable F420-dependent enzyme
MVTGTTAEPVPIPASHHDLLTRPVPGVLTAVGSDGLPWSSLVWLDAEEGSARINTTLEIERQNGRDLRSNPSVSLLVVDPDDTSRFIQIRGEVELATDGATEHLDVLTRKYTCHSCYYGYVSPAQQETRETRVIGRILARRITLDAIHARDAADAQNRDRDGRRDDGADSQG